MPRHSIPPMPHFFSLSSISIRTPCLCIKTPKQKLPPSALEDYRLFLVTPVRVCMYDDLYYPIPRVWPAL